MTLKKILLALMIISSFALGKTVLVIGDSMAEAIDRPIIKILKNNDIECKVHFKRGTRVDYWIKNKDLFLNEASRPDIVLISLGTNDLVAKKTNTKIITELETLIGIITSLGIDKKNVLVIAPPIEDDKGLNNDLSEHFGKQAFLSKEINLTFSKDKIHPTMQSNVVWAASIVDYIATNNQFLNALIKTKPKTMVSMK